MDTKIDEIIHSIDQTMNNYGGNKKTIKGFTLNTKERGGDFGNRGRTPEAASFGPTRAQSVEATHIQRKVGEADFAMSQGRWRKTVADDRAGIQPGDHQKRLDHFFLYIKNLVAAGAKMRDELIQATHMETSAMDEFNNNSKIVQGLMSYIVRRTFLWVLM